MGIWAAVTTRGRCQLFLRFLATPAASYPTLRKARYFTSLSRSHNRRTFRSLTPLIHTWRTNIPGHFQSSAVVFPIVQKSRACFSNMSSGDRRESLSLVEFNLSSSSILKIQKEDITRWFVDGFSDAIVNPANVRMLGGGGADGAIHRAAGPQLKEACYKVPEVQPGVRCPTGEARITLGFMLPASHVIHTVGPIYDLDNNPEASLKNAYRNSLRVAKDNNIQYIAFPAISCGVYRYPLEEAAAIAISTVKEFGGDFKEVHFVLFSDNIYDVWVKKANEIVGQ
ncbi:hypothetical protein Nepgr_028899 [Nepenthes gracilis]|uniref:Macro domain-containing protein n=1 Tax=Nepenthes gracilis TaxID=150966 RepID=A0AAD3TDD1_NEPGR|nr:hypothetical protein Nepgr_028899 [Nepenthes gracilis]